jgi:hypothetical protein
MLRVAQNCPATQIQFIERKLPFFAFDSAFAMVIADWIQLGVLLIATLSLIAVFIQLRFQTRIMRAQFLRDRFEMYWRLYEPTPEGVLEWMQACPEDYMPIELFERKYKDNPSAQRKYVGMAQIYEFLVFSHRLKELKIPDPLGFEWTQRWTEDLASHEEFREINEHYRPYYPRFADFVDSLISKSPRQEARPPLPPPIPRGKQGRKKRR